MSEQNTDVKSLAHDSNMLYVPVDKDKIEYYSFEKDIFNDALSNTYKQQLLDL